MMAMMMSGRVLLVCALCVLWCGVAVVVSTAGDVVQGGINEDSLSGSQSNSREEQAGKPELSKSIRESVESGDELLGTQSGTDVSEQRNSVKEAVAEDVGKERVHEEGLGIQQNGESEQQLKKEERGQTVTRNPQTKVEETLPPSQVSQPIAAPTLQLQQPSLPASGGGDADRRLGGIDDSGQTAGGESFVGASDISRGAGETSGDSKGSEGTISGPPSGGASSSPISNEEGALQKDGDASPTQDTTPLKTQEQSGPTASSEHAPLKGKTPERSTPDAQQHSSDTQEDETSRVADGNTIYSAAEHSAVRTKNYSGVPTTTSNAPTTPHVQPPAPAETPPAERLPPLADSTVGDRPAAPETVQANDTATPGNSNSSTVKMIIATVPGNSDGSTAVSHTTSPLLLIFLVACAAAAAVVAA
ncbi:mucin-associated surface protein (MASP), putative [Trypanosoma cruzi marinkellei]|uniref:Mucin-associated surface protein (MASP), putative n=1 Tax=Trypanosoma cruzi marinkellei TaxID=85056 RepID=K2NKF4_TRYCR|nr:mucin-associated surface protein (MASP), putative [Trypanosoma cruzi marinkellei]